MAVRGNSNPSYQERRVQREFNERLAKLEGLYKTLASKLEAGTTAKAEITQLEDLKLKELKALCDNNGIDYTDFGNTKAPYIKALEDIGK